MLFESILSNSFLLFASGSCIYLLRKHSYDHNSHLQAYFISATIGIFGFCIRSSGSLIYNLFFRTYPIGPKEIEDETSKRASEILKGPFRDRSFFNRISSTVGLAGLIYSVYHYNRNEITGGVLVLLLTVDECICAIETWKSKKRAVQNVINNDASFIKRFAESIDGYLDFLWIITGGVFGWVKGNSFCLLAFLPYSISVLVMTSLEFDNNSTTQTAINDYMIIAHILLITEAIRQSPLKTIS